MAKRTTPRIAGRAVGYVRTSTDRQDNSVDDQRHRIGQYCAARGWELVEVYVDAGVSGAKASRPGLDAMIAAVLADGVSHVVATKLDRLGRSVAHVVELYDRLETKGVGLVFIDQGIDTSTPAGKFMRTILAGVAEFERELISERVRAGMAEAKRKGARFGKRSELDPAVRARIAAMSAGGTSMNAIARALNDEGVATGQGGARWYASSVRAVLVAEGSLEAAAR